MVKSGHARFKDETEIIIYIKEIGYRIIYFILKTLYKVTKD
jgi:hypothetical protein